jgi:hypothetical protein
MVPFPKASGAGLPGSAAARDIAIQSGITIEHAKHRNDNRRLRSCNAVLHYHLHASDGDVGHVEGYLIDDETWAIRYLVVYTSNWWFGHRVLIAPQWISGVHWTEQTVTVDLSRDSVKASPPYDQPAELDRQHETGLYTHYKRAPYWTTGSTHKSEI